MRQVSRCLLLVVIGPAVTGHAQQEFLQADASLKSDGSGSNQPSATSTSIALPATTTNGNGTCPSRTANYITHTLPQQCLRTDRSAVNTTQRPVPAEYVGTNFTTLSYSSSGSVGVQVSITISSSNDLALDSQVTGVHNLATSLSTAGSIAAESASATIDVSGPASTDTTDTEGEPDSPLDNSKFLSFEEWKKQNLVKSAEQGRDLRERAERQRPGINNALEGFGEDGEIDLDFSGFGTPEDGPRQQRAAYRSKGESVSGQTPTTPYTARSKDAGKTCKERTNYASFDCAATVLKNNPECKSASSVLVENKDSYMLNTCSAQNKFFIVELCDDILVDTVVLANYEFFSSIFRHFRVSVSNTYPVKLDKWKDLGTYEARNTREVQAFFIEHPQIWARYLRVEFLTHYGSEYYCPVSLLRIHGTTMLEDMRAQEETLQTESNEETVMEEDVTVSQELSALPEEIGKSTSQSMSHVPTNPSEAAQTTGDRSKIDDVNATRSQEDSAMIANFNTSSHVSTGHALGLTKGEPPSPPTCPTSGSSKSSVAANAPTKESSGAGPLLEYISSSSFTSISLEAKSSQLPLAASDTQMPQFDNEPGARPTNATSMDSRTSTAAISPQHTTASPPAETTEPGQHLANSTAITGSSVNTNSTSLTTATTAASPPQPQPSTQESFFKSITKRLQQLEANSTLSLQYIEEQSRILRDAFSKVEKRQISATTSFLANLNETVMQELHGFRQAYDQLWQSTVIELEGQREQNQREMLALTSRLTLVADELVWQKRMGIVQSTLLLLCLGLVLFSRGGSTHGYLEVPLVQQMLNKSNAVPGRAGWESPPASPSPDSRSPVSLFRRRIWRSVTEPSVGSDGPASVTDSRPESKDGPLSVDVHVEPPTPPSAASVSSQSAWDDAEEEDGVDFRESQSGPSTPRGTREQEAFGEAILDAG